ncbi:hypothetical protein HK101_004476 [Irineochytrium annulatum]|nr:hypothetical protein HK101_004476 [Irineochytrium annulatum]
MATTVTSKSVLAPLAEAVTALILIISESDINKSPMPDLSALAKIVDEQIRNLVAVGSRVANQASADTQLKTDMPQACDIVTKSSDQLLSSTTSLVRDPHSSQGRASLLEAVCGILNGTTAVLGSFDSAEVRRLLATSSLVRQHVAEIESPTTSHEPAHYINRVAVYGQTTVHLAQLAHKRSTELLHPSLQQRLRNAVADLVVESPMVVSACSVALKTVGSDEGKKVRTTACGRIVAICREIELVVQLVTEEQIIAYTEPGLQQDMGRNKRKIEEAAADIRSAVASGVEANLTKALADYHHFNELVMNDTKKSMDRFTDREAKAELQMISEVIAGAQPKIIHAAQAALAKPDRMKTQQELLSLLDLVASKHRALESARNRAIVGELASSTTSLSDAKLPGTSYSRVQDATMKGYKPALATALAEFEADTGRLTDLAGMAAESCMAESPETGRDVQALRRRLGALRPAIAAAGNLVIMHPKEKEGVEHFKAVCEAWENQVKELQDKVINQEGTFKGNELLKGTKNAIERHMNAMETASSANDPDRCRKEIVDMMASAGHFVSMIRKEVDLTEDLAYKANLEYKMRDVERVMPQLIGKARAILESHKVNTGEIASLHGQVKELAVRFNAIGDIIRSHKGYGPDEEVDEQQQPTVILAQPDLTIQGISVQLLENAMADSVFVEEEAPKLMTDVEAKANPIQAAAIELKVETSHWASKDNPIVAAASKMSDRLTDLASAHALLRRDAGSAEVKRAFITAAQQIMSEASSIILSSRPVAECCTDRRLRQSLLSTLDRVDTLAQQLKIIAAVKASNPGDTDRDAQLIACARNLMVGVKTALNEAEAGSLRQGGSGVAAGGNVAAGSRKPSMAAGAAGHTAGERGLKFRRNVYRSRKQAAAR